MHKNLKKLLEIKDDINLKIKNTKVDNLTKIIAVTKNFNLSEILPIINFGHIHFGENKVQEAQNKWKDYKNFSDSIKLHMIGKLQTNKVKYAVPLFDYIHSLDNLKLAEKISQEQIKKNKFLKIFIQINIANESQKNGIDPKDVKYFYKKCISDFKLDIIGLMCIPPQKSNVKTYFAQMLELKNSLGLKELSMGMSSDYLEAVEHGSTFVRIGSKIFGERS